MVRGAFASVDCGGDPADERGGSGAGRLLHPLLLPVDADDREAASDVRGVRRLGSARSESALRALPLLHHSQRLLLFLQLYIIQFIYIYILYYLYTVIH